MSYLLLIVPISLSAQETIAPPALGQQTQGETVESNESTVNSTKSDEASTQKTDATEKTSVGLLGTTRISELRRENGQIYRIELEHSSGSKQYIDADYSDGKIDSKSNNIEETPNLAKWRLGSW